MSPDFSLSRRNVMSRFARFAAAFMPAIALAAACSSDSPTAPNPPPPPPATVTAVTIGGTADVSEGATSQLTATASLSNGSTQDVTSQATWTSSDGTVATVSNTGLVSALKIGTADISAAYASQTGRRTLQVSAAMFRVSLTVQSVTALSTCDDVFQGLTNGEFAARVLAVGSNGTQLTMTQTTSYPGNPDNLLVYNLSEGESQSFTAASETFTIRGEAGQSLRVQFNATEWDQQIIVIPPSTRWVHDSRLDDASTSRTHSYANGTFSSLGPNTLTIGNSSCGIRLNYSISATR
jgi:hypothetical protein